MICIHCGHKQNNGHFCGMCGVKFEQKNQFSNRASILTTGDVQHNSAQEEPNLQLEQLKKKTMNYIHYFHQYLKNPSHIFNNLEDHFKNGLMTIILFTIIASMTLYQLTSHLLYESSTTPFISQLSGFILTLLGLISIGLLSLYLINHFFGPQFSFKAIISLYSAHLSLATLLALASLIIIFLNAFSFANTLISITLLFTVFIHPLYLVGVLLMKKSTAIEPFYGFIVYTVTFTILLIIFISAFSVPIITQFLSLN